MKKMFYAIIAGIFVMGMTTIATASSGGKEHGGQEHGGAAVKDAAHEHGGDAMKGSGHAQVCEPSKDDIRSTMEAYVQEQAAATGGYFEVKDPDTEKTRKLSLVRVHERVGKTGDYYYSCADFTDVDSGELLDLDLDVESKGEDCALSVADVRIHKLQGVPRYTYDDKDNRIPLTDTKSHIGSAKGEVEAEMKGSAHEHGGKEHGGE